MSFNPYQFKAFAHVVRAGSISEAAKALGVSQSAVSQHLAKLETLVGVRLLVRGRDGIDLTPTGQEFYELADRYVTLDMAIGEKISGYSDLSQGHLRIIANAPQPALRLIARYAEVYARVNIDFSLFDWSTAMELIQKQQIDIAIVTDPTHRQDWYRKVINTARYVLYVKSSHPMAGRDRVSLEEIVTQTLLLPETGSLTQRVVTSALAKYQLQPRRVVKTTTFPVMKEAILAGLGVGIFLEDSAQKESELIEVPVVELDATYETCVVTPKHKLDLRLIRSFMQIVDDAPPG